MEPIELKTLVLVLATALSCHCLAGCDSRSDDTRQAPSANANGIAETSTESTMDFQTRQRQLFYEIDHAQVYQGCQELLRLCREGKLSASTYYCDDPAPRLNELPEAIRTLEPTDVQVTEIMVTIGFLSNDGRQSLMCVSNEFGDPASPEDSSKGLGFRKDPFAMDRLSGTESLDYLNETFEHFEMTLVPGLSYQTFKDEEPRTLEEVKRSNQQIDALVAFMMETLNELAVKKQRLLYRTDHQELLDACRESIKRFNEGAFTEAKINIPPAHSLDQLEAAERERYSKNVAQLPEIILGLEPVYVWFDSQRVMVALIGGMDHAGVCAYLSDGEPASGDDEIELIPGLRYYDDGLREAPADYGDYLNSLRNEALPYLDWRRKRIDRTVPDGNK